MPRPRNRPSGRRVRGPSKQPDLVSTSPIEDVTMVETEVSDDENEFMKRLDDIATGRYPPPPEEGEELADFQKCKTFEEKRYWIISAAVLRNEQHRLQRLRRTLRPGYKFEYFTGEETRMFLKGLDQEA